MYRWPGVILSLAIVSLGAPAAFARKIDLSKETFAAYIRGNIATSNVGKSAYAESSGASTSFSEEPGFGYGGGAGFLFRMGVFIISAGVDVLTPARMLGIEGKDAAGTSLLTLKSTVLGIVPNLGVAYTFARGPRSRFFISGNFGYASVTILNDYQMTAAGTAQYSVGNYTEEGKGDALSGFIGGGFEFILADNAALVLEGGYRSLIVTKFTHVRDGTSLRGTMTKGEPLTNLDNTNRSLNLSGYVGTAALRIYF